MTGGRHARSARSIRLGAAVLVFGTLAPVGCSAADDAEDAVKGKAIAALAEGRWACAPKEVTEETDAFEVEISPGNFTLYRGSKEAGGDEITGVWTVEGGDLAIEFTGPAASGGPLFEVVDFDDLTTESDGFTLSAAGVMAEELERDGEATTRDLDVDLDGADALTLTATDGGDPWTCDRQ